MNRIDRLTAILIQLQTKRVVKAEEIAERFEISLRTVYRDVKALMEAGVPIGSEAGKGYFIVDGYHLPPVMFSQEEASAMLTAGKLVEKMTDVSIRKAYESALLKIKSVLNDSEKDHLENLQSAIEILRHDKQEDYPNEYMAEIQNAISKKNVMRVEYLSTKEERTTREIEPIGIVHYSGRWHLIGWCRLRNGYRDFRVDLIQSLKNTGASFDSRNLFTLQEYFQSLTAAHQEMEKVTLLFDKSMTRNVKYARYYYGYVSEEDLGDRCRMTFLVANTRSFCKWLLMYGNAVEIENPDKLRGIMEEMVDELVLHYKGALKFS
ncbi:helix-turn-helix transcriptional regulator [Chryseosolibacter indicus]|uniref:YafY family transcriptional regulator n=1 Tax=Chryseosolibacter indicus TaxID=2782351 RepID=A0ABS5VQF2_9BACT|nr:YafY family protein [Chryseosolibacter indicus]MBT1702241.1 YafY family transcriptional regulator [Chryseosolibacter indicus]